MAERGSLPTTTPWSTGPPPNEPASAGSAKTATSSCPGGVPGSSSARSSPMPRCRPVLRWATGAAAASAASALAPRAPSSPRACSTPGSAWPGCCKPPASSPSSTGCPWRDGSMAATTARRCAPRTGLRPGWLLAPTAAAANAVVEDAKSTCSSCCQPATSRCSIATAAGTYPNGTLATCAATR